MTYDPHAHGGRTPEHQARNEEAMAIIVVAFLWALIFGACLFIGVSAGKWLVTWLASGGV